MIYLKQFLKLLTSILITPIIFIMLFGASIYAIHETIWKNNKQKTSAEQ